MEKVDSSIVVWFVYCGALGVRGGFVVTGFMRSLVINENRFC